MIIIEDSKPLFSLQNSHGRAKVSPRNL